MKKRLLLLIPLVLLMVGCGKQTTKITNSTSSKTNTTTKSNVTEKPINTTKKTTKRVTTLKKAILLINKNIESAGSVIGGGSYDIGSTVTIKATPSDNYDFLGWYNGSQLVSELDEYEIVLDRDMSLTAKFELSKYSLMVTKNIDEAGTVSGDGLYEYGTTTTLTATANTGYKFVGWYDEGDSFIDDNNTLSITVESEMLIKAIFELEDCVLAINKNFMEAGTVTGSGIYDYGTNVTVEVTEVNTGYKFIAWKDEAGNVLSNDYTYSFEFNASTLIIAYFEKEKYVIMLSSNNSNGSVDGSGTYEYGSLATIYATPNPYYQFDGWYKEGESECVSDKAELSFNVSKNIKYIAHFSKIKYNITLLNEDTSGGSCPIWDNEAFDADYEINLNAYPSVGHTFEGWYEGDTLFAEETNYSFYPEKNLVLTPKWGLVEYNVIITPNQYNDKITIAGAGKYKYGDTLSFSAVLDEENYIFEGWFLRKINNELPVYGYGTTMNRTLDVYIANEASGENNDLYFVAKVDRRNYELTVLNDNNEAGTVSGGGTYKLNSICVITATPNPGYSFAGWYDLDGNLIDPSSSYIYTIGKEDVTFVAKWKKYYTLNTSTNNANYGTYTKYTNELVLNGTSITLVATPNSLCSFDGWYVNDVCVEDNATYIFDMPESNYTCVAKFSMSSGLEPFTFTTSGDEVIITGFASGYEDMENVIIPDEATQIGANAFNGNETIKSLVIGKGVKIINESAFEYTNIETIILGDNLTTIDSFAFGELYQLKWVVINEKLTNMESDSFYDVASRCKVYLKGSSADVINNDEYLSQRNAYFYSENVPDEEGVYWRFVEEVPTIWYTKAHITYYGIDGNTPVEIENNDPNNLEGVVDVIEDIVLKPISKTGYTFLGWYGDLDCTKQVTTIYAGTVGYVTLYAKFAINYYSINVDVNISSAGSVSGSDTYPYNSNVFITASAPNTGYNYLGFYENNELITKDFSYSFKATESRNIVAKYESKKCEVKVWNPQPSRGEVIGEGIYDYGSIVTLEAIANQYFVISGWKNGSTTVGYDATYSFMITKEFVEIRVEFKYEKVHITLDYNGATEGQTSYYFALGSSYTLPKAVKEGYIFLGWYYENMQMTDSSGKSVGELVSIESRTYVAKFKVDYFTESLTLTINVKPEGSGYTNITSKTVFGNSTIGLAALSYLGYKFYGYYDEFGNVLSYDYNYTFTMPCNDYTIEARFYEADEMSNFIYTSTTDECIITGVKDNTVKKIVVPSYVTEISYHAFRLCSNVEEIELPFAGRYKDYTGKSVSPSDLNLGYIFGVYSLETVNSFRWMKVISNDANYVFIPKSLKKVTYTGNQVNPYAFRCLTIDEVVLTNTVVSISIYAFEYSTINKLWFGPNIVECNNKALDYLTANVYYPATEKCYAYKWFKSPRVKNVYQIFAEGTKEITGYAPNCVIPKSATNIINLEYTNVFYNGQYNEWVEKFDRNGVCVPSVYIKDDNGDVTVAGNKYKLSIEKDTIQIKDGVTFIPDAFFASSTAKKVIIPDSVEYIGSCAFGGCTRLEEVIIGNGVTNIGYRAFYNCKQLKKVTFGENVEVIADEAFYNCYSLESIDLPDSVREIGVNCFYECRRVENIRLSNNLRIIPEGAFNCAGIDTRYYSKNGVKTFELVIPNSVEYIGKMAFRYAAISKITLGENLVEIGDAAFIYSSLEGVRFNLKLKTIGVSAFSYCMVLSDIDLANVETIGNNAFKNCEYLRDLTIPNSVTSLASNAFDGCVLLFVVFNDSNLDLVAGENINCSYVVNASDRDDMIYTDEQGLVFFIYDGVNILMDYKGTNKEITLPSSITFKGETITSYEIGNYAFSVYVYKLDYYSSPRITQINTIVIPSNVTKIGKHAFRYQEYLTTVTMANGVMEIGESAFAYNTSLSTITLSNTITSIGNQAFYNATNLTGIIIPNSVTQIGYDAFANAKKLNNVVLSNSLNSIESGTFRNCVIDGIIIPESVKSVGIGAFENAIITNFVLECRGTTFDEDVFKNSKITNLYYKDYDQWLSYTFNSINSTPKKYATNTLGEISPTVTIEHTIYNDKHYINLTVLPLIYTSGNQKIGNYQFAFFNEVTNISLDKNTISVGVYAFYGCNNVESFSGPIIDGKQFGYYFGEYDESLNNGNLVTQVYMDNEEEMSKDYFIPSSLKNITITKGVLPYGYFSNLENVETIGIGDNVPTVNGGALMNLPKLTTVKISGDNISFKGKFYTNCDNVSIVQTNSIIDKWFNYTFESGESNPLSCGAYFANNGGYDNTTITVPNGVTKINNYAFYGCKHLVYICLPDFVTSIGTDAFYGCNSLAYVCNNTSLNIVAGSSTYGYIAQYAYKVFDNSDGHTYYYRTQDYTGIMIGSTPYLAAMRPTKDLVLPESIWIFGAGTFSEYSVYKYAFANLPIIESVTIGSNINSIGEYAFSNCTNLADANISEGITILGNYSFNNCVSLTELSLPLSLAQIMENAFNNCISVKRVAIRTVAYYKNCLNGLSNLEELEIWTSEIANYFGNSKFNNSYHIVNAGYDYYLPCSLTKVIIHGVHDNPDLDNNQVAPYAFMGTTSITDVEFRGIIIEIGNYAFADSGRKNLTIPSSVTTIGSYAFRNTLGVSLNNNNNMTRIGNGAFYNAFVDDVYINNGSANIKANAFGSDHNYSSFTKNFMTRTTNVFTNDIFGNSSAVNIYFNMYESTFNAYISSVENNKILSTAFNIYYRADNGDGEYMFDGTSYKLYTGSQACNLIYELKNSSIVLVGIKDKTITELTIPNYVTEIKEGALSGCSNLEKLTTPFVSGRFDTQISYRYPIGYLFGQEEYENSIAVTQKHFWGYNSNWVDITDVTYYIPRNLEDIVITQEYGGAIGTFYNMENIKTVKYLEENPTAAYNFYNCKSLVSVEYSTFGINSTWYFGAEYLFYNCINLENIFIDLPDDKGMLFVGSDYSFYNCQKLSSSQLGWLIRVGEKAFYNCSSMTTIYIYRYCSTIGENAFTGCTELEKIIFYNTEEEWNKININNCGLSSNTIIYFYSKTQPSISGNYWYYDEDGIMRKWS